MKKVIYLLLFALILNLSLGGAVFAKTNDEVDFTTEAGNAVVLSKLSALDKNERVELKANQTKLFKIERDGKYYVVELINETKKPVQTKDQVIAASTGNASITHNIYSWVGVLQGTFIMTQTWNYSNGTFTYVPSADVSGCTVPWYSWPNAWTNPSVAPPAYNSTTKKYTSVASKDLNINVVTPIGIITESTITCHGSITFDAYGGSSTTYWES